jgi:hypothetical protein
MSIAIVSIAIFSVMFLFSLDMVESRVGITLVGVGLVAMSFFAAIVTMDTPKTLQRFRQANDAVEK